MQDEHEKELHGRKIRRGDEESQKKKKDKKTSCESPVKTHVFSGARLNSCVAAALENLRRFPSCYVMVYGPVCLLPFFLSFLRAKAWRERGGRGGGRGRVCYVVIIITCLFLVL